MKRTKFTEAQIVFALRQADNGVKVEEVCRKLGISDATFYNWKKKYSGMDSELLRKFKELERENSELKRMYADLSLDHRILKNVIEKKL